MESDGVRVSAVELAGATLLCRDSGPPDGEPVLLLHGGASNGATWDRTATALRAIGRRVLAPDLRGHGGSSRTATYPLTGFRDDILGLLDALGIGGVALVGHSLGGHVASLVAQQEPERINRLVFEDSPPPPRDSSATARMSRARLLMLALASVGRRGYSRRALISVIEQLQQPDPAWWEALPRITASTLLVSGGPSSHISPRRLSEVARAVPDCRLVTIPVGHRVHSRAPVAFNAALVPFLE